MSKLAGFLVGAGAAAVAVWGFNTWRHVSDEDLLMAALTDQCLPYILTGDAPFQDLGREVGVYDNTDADNRLIGGGAKIVFDARFVASWGEITEPPLRICRLDGRPMGAYTQAFEIESDDFFEQITVAVQPLGDLQLDQERTDIDLGADDLFQTLGWFETGMSLAQGNRVVMSVAQSQVSNVIVVRDLAD
ncbi:hypothetical protein [Octadecabacter ascidiaceicola]|uniref:hypothetical protein n=1 Tax=Octadecabacter ascidiaceicola TaxID=1655543 RepID=UPI00117DB753|nr:hypothetical protein [Octadecabacter ascidiaceicola]